MNFVICIFTKYYYNDQIEGETIDQVCKHGDIRNAYKDLLGQPEEKYHLETIDAHGRIKLNRVLKI
jgi:hypothetical protein